MEVSYFIECQTEFSRQSQIVSELPCLIATQANLTEQHILVLSTKRNLPIATTTSLKYERTNNPMTISFNGKMRFTRRFLNLLNKF